MASIRTVSTTSDSITVCITGLATEYSRDDRIVYWYIDEVYDGEDYLDAYAAESYDWEFTGLEPETRYYIQASIEVPDPTGEGEPTYVHLSKYITTDRNPRPDNFYWPASTGTTGDPINVTAADWNAFCDRINEFREYTGLRVVSFTRAVRGQPMYADQYNEALDAILDIPGSGTQVSSQSYVYSGRTELIKSQFNNLAAALNDIP